MERREAKSLGDIMRRAIEESENARKFDEVTAIGLWPSVIGKEIAARSPRPQVRNGIMTVRIFSAVLRQELNMQRSTLAGSLNKAVGKDVIKEIRFIG